MDFGDVINALECSRFVGWQVPVNVQLIFLVIVLLHQSDTKNQFDMDNVTQSSSTSDVTVYCHQ